MAAKVKEPWSDSTTKVQMQDVRLVELQANSKNAVEAVELAIQPRKPCFLLPLPSQTRPSMFGREAEVENLACEVASYLKLELLVQVLKYRSENRPTKRSMTLSLDRNIGHVL